MRVRDKILIAVAVLVGAFFLATGLVDLDWMVTVYYYDGYNGANGFWWFTPAFGLNWYNAYLFTVSRLVGGSITLGFGLGKLERA